MKTGRYAIEPKCVYFTTISDSAVVVWRRLKQTHWSYTFSNQLSTMSTTKGAFARSGWFPASWSKSASRQLVMSTTPRVDSNGWTIRLLTVSVTLSKLSRSTATYRRLPLHVAKHSGRPLTKITFKAWLHVARKRFELTLNILEDLITLVLIMMFWNDIYRSSIWMIDFMSFLLKNKSRIHTLIYTL